MSKELIRLQNLVMEFDGERILDDIDLSVQFSGIHTELQLGSI